MFGSRPQRNLRKSKLDRLDLYLDDDGAGAGSYTDYTDEDDVAWQVSVVEGSDPEPKEWLIIVETVTRHIDDVRALGIDDDDGDFVGLDCEEEQRWCLASSGR